MGKNYEIIEHPADLQIKVRGENKKYLFENAMQAMTECLRPEVKDFPAEEKIRVLSEDLPSLLVDFLNEINYLNEVNREVYHQAHFEKITDREVVAEIFGHKVSRFGLQIKGVTFHDLKVKEGQSGDWEARILFDI